MCKGGQGGAVTMPYYWHFVEEGGRDEEGAQNATCLPSSRKNCPTEHAPELSWEMQKEV